MAYQVKCDDYILFDLRDENLILVDPKVRVEVNTVGEGSFTIYNTHPHYGALQKMKSVIEVSDEVGVIFRGRITTDTIDFDNGKAVDMEGVMAYFNDSIVRPYDFPKGFENNSEYIAAASNGNVVEFFLKWLIDNHNSQVEEFQQFKLGRVTVSDPNNKITKSDTGYAKTWDVLKSKLFESSLGGYLCIRYEDDGNYIDYLSDFTLDDGSYLRNTQDIIFGENMLDLVHEQDASETYSAIIPIGKDKLTIDNIPDNTIIADDDIVKRGDTLYSKSAVEKFGWIYAPVSETTWDDVTLAQNLLANGVEYLASKAVMLSDRIEITAADLHFTDDEIRSFRIYRKQQVFSVPHGLSATYDLTCLDIDILNPQNTKITVGDTSLSLTEMNKNSQSDMINRIEMAERDVEENRKDVTELKDIAVTNQTTVYNTAYEIVQAATQNYVEKSTFETYQEEVESKLVQTSNDITMSFNTEISNIKDVNGDLQEKVQTMYDYIRFDSDGIHIGDQTGLVLHVNNDNIEFSQANNVFGSWNGNQFVTKVSLKIGNFAFFPRADGLSFERV